MVRAQRLTDPEVGREGIESSALGIAHSTTRLGIDSFVFDDSPDPAGPTANRTAVPIESVTAGTPGPVSRADRTAAAACILRAHPEWSDRAVAAAAGMSDKTVARIRAQSSAADATRSDPRLGRDGRLRPLDGAERRRRAAAVFLDRPDAGLREVARATGLSPATVRDVRQRIQRGEDPVPDRYRDTRRAERTAAARRTPQPAVRAEHRGEVPGQQLLARLGEDPSLRLTEAGRRVLRWLHHYSVDDEAIATLEHGLPRHWAAEVADLAHGYAATWSRLAHQLLRRDA
ncbi:streptomycin biosynthesis protein [Actinophytocola sp.]|uniref:streptomycin biosynthesis protein n=1 Tax=Actinophytocola sp. TaxID=1872138 RepID=UPI00389ADBFC